jgi:hypothetical protein
MITAEPDIRSLFKPRNIVAKGKLEIEEIREGEKLSS